jgi:formylglycine-generating enzyme required for sulfatase activity
VTTQAGIELVWIPPGSVMMGSESGGSKNEKPAHRVTIGEGFYMGKYEVTQAQWQRVMGYNPSHLKGDDLPVEDVTWEAALDFIARLNAQNDGYTYRLPTEAEWEYAARAGTTGEYSGDLNATTWYYGNSGDARLHSGPVGPNAILANRNRAHPVGSKLPNDFGLFDMSGNVFEWCQDWYHDNYVGAPTDGSAWLSGGEQKQRVVRGGAWFSSAYAARPAFRSGGSLGKIVSRPALGLRVAAVAKQ